MADYVDPTQPDPRFPGRPTHPDFVRLSNAVQAMDAAAEAHVKLADLIGCDLDALTYVIQNRLNILNQLGLIPPSPYNIGIYIDAFTLGRLYAEGAK